MKMSRLIILGFFLVFCLASVSGCTNEGPKQTIPLKPNRVPPPPP